MSRERMKILRRALQTALILILLGVAAICSWAFLYTEDLPDFKRLSEFAPDSSSIVSDPCLAGSSTAIPFQQISQSFREAMSAIESQKSMRLQTARSMTCGLHQKTVQREITEL